MVAHSGARGFTLPELLAVVAVMAALAALAAPSFTEMLASQRAKGAAADLFTALLRTRSEAIKRNAEVSLTPADSGWQGGWSIVHPGDNTIKLEEHGAVVGATISGPDSLVYLPNGRIKGANAPVFGIEVAGAAHGRCIEVDLSGRPYQKPAAC